ncbi:MAG: AMP-binding protein [Planctomycetes bacterium]|nr:AMP-binding protein [Planctomycetota bacterium]
MTVRHRVHPEQSNRTEIQHRQTERLRILLNEVAGKNPFWTQKFQQAGVDVATIRTLEDLSRLPLTTKQDLVADHAAHAPYGSNLTYEITAYSRMHQTSGTTGSPMRWLDTPKSWNWFIECWAQIYRMVGLTPEDRLAFPFSFGPFIGFWAAFEGAARFGHLCLAGGGMSSQARLKLIADNQATVICCTPTYALRLAEVAAEEGIDLAAGSVRALIVAGEPGGSIPAMRKRIESAWGARLFDHWGMTEMGSLAVECVENPGGLHLLETECIAEILDPKSSDPVEPGNVGELVITNLGRLGSPLIRYRTGDLVKADTNRCPCGRELLRLEGGILGRCDDMLTIRGNNVFPSSLEAILREFDEIAEYRITVHTVRSMQHLKIEIEPTPNTEAQHETGALLETIQRAIKDRLNFQADVEAVSPGTLPRFELKGRRFFRAENSE